MRRAQKEQVDSVIELLGRMHDEIKKVTNMKNIELSLMLLEKCQETAIRLGALIEEAEGEGFGTIPLLENYCELIYQIYQEVCQGRFASHEEVHQRLDEALARVRHSIQKEVRIKLEVVFLPCKVSQWDSLESVFKAAEQDPDCDTYVIPIPYYYKNPEGSFREMHYEGEQYPKDVPVIRYDEFDFGKHQPDMIFIHNPYDEYNHSISVHPFFYSENLKKYTKNLIYIPYFTLDEIHSRDQRAVDSMKYFVVMPGVVNADKVIVQSETMSQAYINFLTKEAGENTREIWEKKIIGLGSPKEDKLLNMKKDNLNIPEDWLRIFKKPDGSWKKIILYYTSVSDLLQYKEHILQKLQNILRTFQENRKNIALIWHPQPLVRETLKVLYPPLWQEYEEIVQAYCKAGWGVYDESEEINWAALCDAYYGDRSATAFMFHKLGKPVLMQKATMTATVD